MLRRMPPGVGDEGEPGADEVGPALDPSPEAADAAAALPETLDSPTAGPAPLLLNAVVTNSAKPDTAPGAAAAAHEVGAGMDDGADEAMLSAPIGAAPIGSGVGRGGAAGAGTDDLPPEDTLPEHRIQAGCTAVVAVLQGNEMWVANAGDSRAVLCRGGKAVPMSEDHKPVRAPAPLRHLCPRAIMLAKMRGDQFTVATMKGLSVHICTQTERRSHKTPAWQAAAVIVVFRSPAM